MQAWGTQSRFTIRDTGLEPSKSGVVGLLCAALGKPRDEAHPDNRGKPALADLAALRMGVRVDREGAPHCDFHTAGGGENYGVVKSSGTKGDTVVSYRHYLADADFLVGLESDDEALLRRLDEALVNPRWQLFLGRKSFVPGVPVHALDGLWLNTSLEDALNRYEWPVGISRTRGLIEPRGHDPEAAEVRHDVPLSFAARRFTLRYVKTVWFDRPADLSKGENDAGNTIPLSVATDPQPPQP
jgi:CRISPR system Cascade subunit CasD